MQELVDAWKARLQKDLAGFADRGADPTVEAEGHTLRAAWVTRGKEQSQLFSLNAEGTLRWASGPTGDDAYTAFLASEPMADLGQLAAASAATIKRQPDFVASQAVIDDGIRSPSDTLTATPEALAGLADKARHRLEDRTNMFFLKGDPGAGKTTVLREATALQAKRYLDGEGDFLFFYVSAQGRELSNLRDAFSGELDDLRASFTRDAIATLARAGLLIPVVDGFDELLGTAGYSGAFSSLQSLLAELDGLGAVVVSARSAFYDVEFLGRSSSPANQANISITTVELQPWTDQQLEDYLNRASANGDPGRTAAALKQLDPDARQLLKRPFFANQFSDFAARSAETNGSISLFEHLIAAYIDREAGKIVDANGDPVLPADGHRRLFELAASEMWESEARQLSIEDLRTLTELASEEFGLGADEAAQLATKVTSYAGFRSGLANGATQGDFIFEHEVYFDYFLARAVERMLRDSRYEDLGLFLDRGVIPETIAPAAIRALENSDTVDPWLLKCSAGIRFENRRRNLGGLLLAFARGVRPLRDVAVQGLAFVNVTSGPTQFRNVCFDNCTFVGVDLCGASFDNCEAHTSTFQSLKLDNDSHMMIRGLHPGQNVGSVHHNMVGEVYAPRDVEDVLVRLGAPTETQSPSSPSYSDRAQVLIQLLHRAARAYRRTNILYLADDHLRQLFYSDFWPELKQLLLRNGVVTEEVRSAAGPKAYAYRLRVNVDELLIGQTMSGLPPGPLAGMWQDLRSLE